ncbi:MAG TPA: hypothetical protein VF697_06280, partial [Archangium sp.]
MDDAWINCPHCGLKHRPRAVSLCPRCGRTTNTARASAIPTVAHASATAIPTVPAPRVAATVIPSPPAPRPAPASVAAPPPPELSQDRVPTVEVDYIT